MRAVHACSTRWHPRAFKKIAICRISLTIHSCWVTNCFTLTVRCDDYRRTYLDWGPVLVIKSWGSFDCWVKCTSSESRKRYKFRRHFDLNLSDLLTLRTFGDNALSRVYDDSSCKYCRRPCLAMWIAVCCVDELCLWRRCQPKLFKRLYVIMSCLMSVVWTVLSVARSKEMNVVKTVETWENVCCLVSHVMSCHVRDISNRQATWNLPFCELRCWRCSHSLSIHGYCYSA